MLVPDGIVIDHAELHSANYSRERNCQASSRAQWVFSIGKIHHKNSWLLNRSSILTIRPRRRFMREATALRTFIIECPPSLKVPLGSHESVKQVQPFPRLSRKVI